MRIAVIASITVWTALCFAPARAEAGEGDPAADPDGGPGADELEGDPAEAQAAKPAKKKSRSKTKTRNDEACDFVTPIHWHEVEAGEHLGLIAGRYGVLSEDLIELNPKIAANPDHIRVGQKLAVCPDIPPRDVVVLEHVVATGETFNEIAYQNDLTPTTLLEMQEGRLRDPNKLRVGDRLKIVVVGEIVSGFEPKPPQRGKLVNGRKLPGHSAYTIKRPHLAYGTARTIQLIGRVVDNYQRRVPGGPKLRIGDMSKNGGGPLQGHLSHQEGRDIDIGFVLEGKLSDRLHFSGATANNIDLRRTWTLIEEFIATGEVRYIFLDYEFQQLIYEYAKNNGVSKKKLDEYFQYPRGIGRNHGIVRHWRGHRNHIHVRFR